MSKDYNYLKNDPDISEIEAEMRRDASDVATEVRRRGNRDTGNALFKRGYHTQQGIFDSTQVGEPDARDTHTPRHKRKR